MAADLSTTPTVGVNVQACGDAHALNFGIYATPERHIVFDVNDFDETLPAPWEYDVKRLAASLVLDVRSLGWDDDRAREAAHVAVARYGSVLDELAGLTTLQTQYAQMDERAFFREYTDPVTIRYARKSLATARKRTNRQAARKWVRRVDGIPRFVENPPLITRLSDERIEEFNQLFDRYRSTLQDNRRHVLEQFRFRDVARKVVGVGSVGMRSFMVLFEGRGGKGDPLILQAKEATSSVLRPYVGPSGFDRHGQRVVVGQRLMQASSDPFLGWASFTDRDYYVRQLRDHKGKTDPTQRWSVYRDEARIIGGTLARAHARSVDPALLRGYIGRGGRLAEVMVSFGIAYATQTEADFEVLKAAAAKGVVPVESGV
jgi:uncharacterized protein (DUF2252 family)